MKPTWLARVLGRAGGGGGAGRHAHAHALHSHTGDSVPKWRDQAFSARACLGISGLGVTTSSKETEQSLTVFGLVLFDFF